MSSSKLQHSSQLEEKPTMSTEFLKEPNDGCPSSVQSSNSLSSSSSIYYFVRKFRQRNENERYQQVLRLGTRRWRSMILLNRAERQLWRLKFKNIWNKPKSLELTQSLSSRESFSLYKKCPECGHCRNVLKRRYSSSTTITSISDSSSESTVTSHQSKKKKCM